MYFLENSDALQLLDRKRILNIERHIFKESVIILSKRFYKCPYNYAIYLIFLNVQRILVVQIQSDKKVEFKPIAFSRRATKKMIRSRRKSRPVVSSFSIRDPILLFTVDHKRSRGVRARVFLHPSVTAATRPLIFDRAHIKMTCRSLRNRS